jgi:hypothetical protein
MIPWHHKVDEAQDTEDLLTLAREYLGGWDPEDLAMIPAQARPTRIKGVDDIAYWHQRLVDCYCTGAAKSRECERVRSLLHFFASALQKAAELRGVPPISEHEAAARLFSEHSVPKLFTSAMAETGGR